MSQRGGRPIDFQAWAQNQIVKRAVAALEARDEAFAERNADTPLPQLARYLSRCAISLGHSPSPSEVDGGTFIEQRFGSWAAAMAAARLPQPRSMRKLRDTARYKAEKVKQEPLFREERRQKRQRKLARYLSRCAISLGHSHPPAKWMAVRLLSSVLAAGQPRWRRQGCRSLVPCASCATPLAIRRKR